MIMRQYRIMKITEIIPLCLLRQVLAAFAANLHGLGAGFVFGYSAVLLPQLKEDASVTYDAKYDSWVAAVIPLAMALGCIITGPTIDRFGRRFSLLLLSIPFTLGWVVIAFSYDANLLIVGRAITGLCAGAFRPMSTVYIGEVAEPKFRSMLLVSTSLSSNLGVLLSHFVGSYVYWKTVALISCIPCFISVVIFMYLKESPLWLISKGKFEEGSEYFYWFRDKNEAADEELCAVLSKQTNKSQDLSLKDTLRVAFSKAFIVPFMICSVIFVEGQFCGTNVINFYAHDMIKATFSDNVDSFVVMIIIDAIRVCGTASVFCTVKHLPRRFIFLLCSVVTTICIFCLAGFLFSQNSNMLWIGLTSIVLYAFFSISLLSTGWSYVSEMYPSSVRGLGSASTASLSFFLLFIAVKMTPGIVDAFGISAFYIISGCITAVCTVILYFVLPETNGKTLQEIEDSIGKENSPNLPNTSDQTRFYDLLAIARGFVRT